MSNNLRSDYEGRALEELHTRAEAKIETFKYDKLADNPKGAFVRLGCGELVKGSVQVIRKKGGGESLLHYHETSETFWYILSGRARFYGKDGELVADLGPGGGIVTPRYARYRYEIGDAEELEILQVMASDCPDNKSGRVGVDSPAASDAGIKRPAASVEDSSPARADDDNSLQ